VYPAIGLQSRLVSLLHYLLIVGVYGAFWETGDWAKGTFIQAIGSVLDQGIQVLLYYGYLISARNAIDFRDADFM